MKSFAAVALLPVTALMPFCSFVSLMTVQDDGTFGDEEDSPALAASPASVSLGTDSSEDEDDEDGDAAEHRMNVRTGESSFYSPLSHSDGSGHLPSHQPPHSTPNLFHNPDTLQ